MSTPTPILISAGVEPVSIAEIGLWVKDPAPEEESLLLGLITAARQWFEIAMDRQLTLATWELRLPWFDTLIEFPYPPLHSVVSVKYDDVDSAEQTVAAATYNVVTSATPGYLELADGESWPQTAVGPEVVRIRFIAGYGDAAQVPELVKAGIKMLVTHWTENRGNTADVPAAAKAIAISAGAYRF